MKKWYQSSTVLINLLGIILVVLDMVVRTGSVSDPDVLAILVAAVNIIRRFQAPARIQAVEKSIV